jgi:hypothetical protein
MNNEHKDAVKDIASQLDFEYYSVTRSHLLGHCRSLDLDPGMLLVRIKKFLSMTFKT